MSQELEQPKRHKRGWMKLRISKIIQETHDTRTLFFVDDEEGGRAFDYTAGQYLTFRFDDLGPKPMARSYTMSSSPCETNHIAVTVKELTKGIVSEYLCRNAKEGDILRARGPIGKFCYFRTTDAPHLAMIAAGSGVTPFTSMLREYAPHLGKEDAPSRMTLLVSYRSTEDLINWDTLNEASKIPGVRVVTTLSREDARDKGFLLGRINEEILKNVFTEDLKDTTYMTCGPTEMMNATCKFLRDHHVSNDHIKVESYESDSKLP